MYLFLTKLEFRIRLLEARFNECIITWQFRNNYSSFKVRWSNYFIVSNDNNTNLSKTKKKSILTRLKKVYNLCTVTGYTMLL